MLFYCYLDSDQGGVVEKQQSCANEEEFLHEPSLGSRNSAYVAGNPKTQNRRIIRILGRGSCLHASRWQPSQSVYRCLLSWELPVPSSRLETRIPNIQQGR